MYIANTTKQNWRLNIRVPEMPRHQVVMVQSGHQTELGRAWNPIQVSEVITQLERFGARPARDSKGKLLRFPGILYSTDKPIPVDQIEMGHEAVVEDQSQRSVTELTKSALGFDASLRDKKTRKRVARVSALEITQDVPKGVKPSGEEVKFGVSVVPDGHDELKID